MIVKTVLLEMELIALVSIMKNRSVVCTRMITLTLYLAVLPSAFYSGYNARRFYLSMGDLLASKGLMHSSPYCIE